MKKIITIILLLSIGMSMISCTEKVDLDPRERGVFVYSILEDTTIQTVQLKYTSYVSENYCPPVEEAEVYIEKLKYGEEEIVEERYDFNEVSDGVWQASFRPHQWHHYRLKVNIPNREQITATTKVPTKNNYIPPMKHRSTNNAEVSSISTNTDYEELSKKFVPFSLLLSYMDYIPESGKYKMCEYISCQYMHNLDPTLPNYKDMVNDMKRCSWLFEDYEYFGCYAIYRLWDSFSAADSVDIIKRDIVGNMVISFGPWGDFSFIPSYYYYPFTKKYMQQNTNYDCQHPLSYAVIESINTDYELYIKDVIAKSLDLNRKDQTDLTQLWEQEDIYSNIQNGVGIFAAKSRRIAMFKDYIDPNREPLWDDMKIPGWND